MNNEEKFKEYQDSHLRVSRTLQRIEQKQKARNKKIFKISLLCTGLPIVLAIILFIQIRDAGFFNIIGFELVYAGIPAFILSIIQNKAIDKINSR